MVDELEMYQCVSGSCTPEYQTYEWYTGGTIVGTAVEAQTWSAIDCGVMAGAPASYTHWNRAVTDENYGGVLQNDPITTECTYLNNPTGTEVKNEFIGGGSEYNIVYDSGSECATPPSDSECSDGINNDGDSYGADYPNDPGCTSAADTTENPNPECSDGANNDSDSYGADYPNDPGCTSAADTTESPNPQCSDGVNNDGAEDANIDYPSDTGCASANDTSESPNVALNPTAYIQASSDRVNSGQSVNVSFSAADVSSCSVTKNGVTVWGPNSASPAPGIIATSTIVSTITTQSEFIITCTNGNATDSTLVNVTPVIIETP